MNSTIELDFEVQRAPRGRKVIKPRPPKQPTKARGPAAVPRLARLMALAIRMEEMVRAGEVSSYAELAKLGRVTRARLTQIIDLLNLCPAVQEEILFLPSVVRKRDSVGEHEIREMLRTLDWKLQEQLWGALRRAETH